MKKEIKIGSIAIGGENPVIIQSMANTDTKNTEETIKQIEMLESAGCELVRLATYDEESARAIRAIKDRVRLPLVADVHFDYKIAIASMEAGADKVRINPGNIGAKHHIKYVADAAKAHGIPIRVGANSGSIGAKYRSREKSDALVESALENVRYLEECGFYDIVIALKASDVNASVAAYRKMNTLNDYPLHLGITEAGAYHSSIIKSSIGVGSLLLDDIGDTIRISMTGDPEQEIKAAQDILQYTGKRSFHPEIIACPTCARTNIDLIHLYEEVEKLVENVRTPLKIAVMGCVVNGPGEARDADIGIAGERGAGIIFKKGKPVAKVKESELLARFKEELNTMIG
ncbi:MAG: flavodoxin-dependent (E)-4-hydroxy-3-methylbut-2-enyl-diphosphate synthase [Christensenellaceae bacterium]|jgi:(E)-4-hydroxy-3-methylbut-2-enyl-diphosphate synthase